MKLFFITSGLLLLSVGLNAQPVIAQADYQPVNNETFGFYESDSSANPGSAGENVVWDFSNISQGTLYNSIVKSCNGNADCANYAGASYYVETYDSTNRVFHVNDVAGESVVARRTPSYTVIYSKPQTLITFPITFLGSSVDSFTYYNTTPGSAYPVGYGTLNKTYDAYGTLKTPVGTYINVIRKKIDMTQHETQINFNSGEHDYIWYQAGIAHPIMRIITTEFDGQYGSKSVSFTNTPPKNVTSIEDLHDEGLSFNIYPNPTISDYFNVSFNNKDINAVVIKDLLGRTIVKKNMKMLGANTNNIGISTVGWVKGVYFVEVHTANHSYVKKVMIE